MSEQKWTAVEGYIDEMLVQSDDVLLAVIEASRAAGLPPVHVSPPEGKLLHVLARLNHARAILEIGTLGAYSTIWLARALPPGGRLVTLEIDSGHAAVAQANIARAGLGDVIELRLGPALETLEQLAAEKRGPFDLVFIDADKPSNPEYFNWALKLTHRGSLIIVDNVVRGGKVIEADSDDQSVQGVRRLIELIADEWRVTATAIQTVSSKGYDGFIAALVTADR